MKYVRGERQLDETRLELDDAGRATRERGAERTATKRDAERVARVPAEGELLWKQIEDVERAARKAAAEDLVAGDELRHSAPSSFLRCVVDAAHPLLLPSPLSLHPHPCRSLGIPFPSRFVGVQFQPHIIKLPSKQLVLLLHAAPLQQSQA